MKVSATFGVFGVLFGVCGRPRALGCGSLPLRLRRAAIRIIEGLVGQPRADGIRLDVPRYGVGSFGVAKDVVVEGGLPERLAGAGMELERGFVFESVHEAQEVDVGRGCLQEKVEVVGHQAVGSGKDGTTGAFVLKDG